MEMVQIKKPQCLEAPGLKSGRKRPKTQGNYVCTLFNEIVQGEKQLAKQLDGKAFNELRDLNQEPIRHPPVGVASISRPEDYRRGSNGGLVFDSDSPYIENELHSTLKEVVEKVPLDIVSDKIHFLIYQDLMEIATYVADKLSTEELKIDENKVAVALNDWTNSRRKTK